MDDWPETAFLDRDEIECYCFVVFELSLSFVGFYVRLITDIKKYHFLLKNESKNNNKQVKRQIVSSK